MSEVCYVNVDTWGTLAETCGKYLRKGRGVRVVGRLRQDRWQGEDEKPRERMIVVAEHVEFYPDPNRDESSNDAEETSEMAAPDADMVFEQPVEPKKKKKK